MLLHDDVTLYGKRDFAGGQEDGFRSGKIPRLDLNVVDVVLNNYFLGSTLLGPLSWEKVEVKNINFPNPAVFSSIARAKVYCRLTLI